MISAEYPTHCLDIPDVRTGTYVAGGVSTHITGGRHHSDVQLLGRWHGICSLYYVRGGGVMSADRNVHCSNTSAGDRDSCGNLF